ncbi:zinc finger protein 658B isoform X3 [Nilaparvata lugens]|uniref:zinc finger protein 658B isoform X3 n=1 Tax=Nilaparvata lugens TaxID=108931 RepID=UPI00193D58B4|nr:zinc finger protein 658B isoform X3 [Nilaparvata lugens]
MMITVTNNNLRNRLLLLHQLSVGYECTACKIGFGSRRELMNHLEKVHLNPKKGDYKCTICGKMFGNNQIFRLHSQIHGLREVGAIQEKIREQKSNLSEIEKKITAITSPAENKKAKKKIGLTKVRMEDCLRCDPCSCIYLDKNDYYKHMRNFHKITDLDSLKSSNTPAHFMLVDKPNNRRYKMLPFLIDDVKKPENESDEKFMQAFLEDSKSGKSLSSTTLYKNFINNFDAKSLNI